MVYPRVGGGNEMLMREYGGGIGLSPRGRGKRAGAAAISAYIRSIPAWAGETVGRVQEQWAQMVYPRVGGGNWPEVCRDACPTGLSPRGRGKPLRQR